MPRSLWQAQHPWIRAVAVMEPTGECVDWPWGVSAQGYAQYNGWLGPTRLVKDTVLVLSGRPRPEHPNHHGLHSCHRKICVAPWHLRWGNHRENMLESWSSPDIADKMATGYLYRANNRNQYSTRSDDV